MTCPWCGRPATACPDPQGHARADRASETTWRRATLHTQRIAEPDPNIRRDYQPGTGPVRGLVVGLPVALLLWLPLAALAVRWWW